MRPSRSLPPSLLILSLACASALRAQQATLRGAVVAAEGGERVPYAVVLLEPGFGQRFTDQAGIFAFTGVAPGAYRLRVRQVGYTPVDTQLTISAATPAIRVELRHIPVALAAVTVRAAATECREPRPPEPGTELATLVDQLRQNAERYRLLADQYPFQYRMVRRFTDEIVNRPSQVRTDTITYSSTARWPYAPGRVVTPDTEPDARPGARFVHLPVLADFADSAFQATHCFHLAGLEMLEGQSFVRLDFAVTRGLRSPDVDGTAFLDPSSYQVRRTTVRLTRIQDAVDGVSEWTATQFFREIVPNLILIETVGAMTVLETRRSAGVVGRTEDQHLLSVIFLRPPPGFAPRAGRAPPE
jgi:hypothetical protein